MSDPSSIGHLVSLLDPIVTNYQQNWSYLLTAPIIILKIIHRLPQTITKLVGV